MLKKLDELDVRIEKFYNPVLFLFICMLFAFYEYRIIVSAVFIIIFLYYFVRKNSYFSLFTLWNILFIALCGFSLLWSYNTAQTYIETRIMIELAIISNLIIAFIDNKEKLVSLYKYLVGAGVVLIIRLAYEFPLNTWLSGRLGSTGDFNPNKIGLYLTISALCTFHFALIKNKKWFYVLFSIFTVVIVLTGSRKAFLMLVLGACLLYYLNIGRFKSRSKQLLSLVITVVLLLISYFLVMNIPVFYELLGSRLESMMLIFTGSSDLDYSSNERIKMIEVGMSLIGDSPIWGSGIGSYGLVSGFNRYSHNNYIELLVGLGVIGLILYYSMIIYVIYKLIKVINSIDGNPLLVILSLLLVMDFALVSYNGPIYQLIIALGFVAIRIIKPENSLKNLKL